MNFYGSELWYKAIDNSDKYSITVMPSSIGSFTKLLEDNELCYYGFDNGKIGKISVNKSDIDLIKSLVGHDLAAVMKIEEITKPYTPDDKNVFGTVEYKYIAKKTRQFLTGESEAQQKAILRTAELLKRDGVKFSGRAYGDKVTLTLNEQDMEKATAYYQNALDHIEKLPDQIEQDRIADNLETVIDMMIEQGFGNDQIQNDYSMIIRELSSFRDVEPGDYLMYLNYEYTVDQNLSMFSLLKEIYESGGFDLISPSAAQEKLYQLDKEYKLDMLLREYFDVHSFTDEQKAAVREICIEENSMTLDLKHINETFSPAEIKKLHELWQNNEQETADKLDEIEQFIKAQQEGRTGIGYTDSFMVSGKGTVLWTHRSFDDEKGESFRIYTVTYKEILLAKSLFDNDEDMLDYISKTATSYETKALAPEVLLSYRIGFSKGEMHTAGDAAFLDRVAQDMSRDMDIFTLDDLAAFITDDVDGTISEDQLRQLIKGKTDELLLHGGIDEKLSGYSRSDVLLLCSELKGSPFADKISSNLTEKVKSELEHKGVEIVVSSDIGAEKYTTEQLVGVTKEILGKQEELTGLVAANEFEKATELSRELSRLAQRAAQIKTAIQKEDITQDDVAALRDIEPKRKAVPNMLETEVAQTPKFEKMLGEELGEKSPYEMRRGNLAWREDETAVVSIIVVDNRNDIDIKRDKKNGVLPRGNYLNKDTGITINIGSVGIEDTLTHASFDAKRHVPIEARLSALYHIDKMIEQSICFDTDISQPGKNKSPNTLFMHKMYDVFRFKNTLYLANLTVEEMYSTDKDERFSGTANRFYNLKEIKITPLELEMGFQSHGVPSNDGRAELTNGVINTLTIPQLYELVKQYDHSFYENEQAPGRAQREAEIAAQQEFEQSVKKLDEHNASLDRENPTSVPMDTKLDGTNKKTAPTELGLDTHDLMPNDISDVPVDAVSITIPQNDSPVNDSVDEEKPEYLESETDRFYDYPGTEHIDGIYYNPDGNDGNGQYVTVNSSYDLILEARNKTSNAKEFFDYLNQYGEVYLADRGDYFFTVVEDTLSDEPIFIGTTEKTMKGMIALAEKGLNKQQQKESSERKADLSQENPTSVPMDTKLDGSDFDINEYDDPDYFEQQKLADKEEDETLRRAEAKFTDFAEEYLTNNPTVRNAFESSDKENMRHDIERLMNVIVTDLILDNQMIDDIEKDDLIAFLNEYDHDTELQQNIVDTLLNNVNENLTELKEAREIAKQLDIPFVDRLAEGGDDEPNPYVYDGSMSPEDFEKYQERYFGKSEREADLSQEDSTSVPMDTKLNESEQEKEDDDLLDNLDLGHISDKRDTAWIDQLEKVVEQAEKDFENNYGTDTKPQPSKSRRKNAVVSNVWSDFEYFDGDSRKFGVAEIDKLMKLYDGEIADRKRDFAANGEYYPTYTMEFTIDLPDGRAIEENRELGTGVGGLIDFLKSQGDTYADVIPQLEEQIERENKKPQRSSKRIEKQENDLRQLTLSLDEPPEEAGRNAEKAEQTEVKTVQTDKPSFQDGKPDVSAAEVPQRTSPAQEKEKVDVSNNYRITDEHIGEGTKSERFRNNIEAIKTLKVIESENRLATPEEQAILAKYVGWGGLSECFVERHHSNAELRHNLTDEEYAAARESTMTAFYTPPVVMQQMYKKLGEMGFEGGRVLEPSCGVGNFIGTMPEDMQRSSDIHAVELDSISGRIAQKLYPAADVQVKGFEKTRFKDNSFDVAVGNVPFGDISVRDKQYDKHNWRIHNYFFGKSLDKVRPGGVVAFLTSRYTLDSKNSAFRQYLAQRADLLGAVRLPTGTFSKAAGTEVVSDIIFLQKRDEVGMPEIVPDWVQTTQTEDGFSLNKYFDEHPEMILGEIQAGKGMGGRPEMIVKANEDVSLADQLEQAMQHINGTISEQSEQREEEIEVHFQNEAAAPEDLRNLSLFEQDGKVFFKTNDEAVLWDKAKSDTIVERAKAFIGLRDMTRAILDAMVNDCSDVQLNAMQQELSKLYDDFGGKYGLIHSQYNKRLFGDDISYQLVAALESKYDLKTGEAEKSDLFTKRTIRPPVRVTSIDTAQEALAISMAERGRVDLDFMSALYETDRDTIINELKGQIFPVPELSTDDEIVYQERSEYLSGDIRQKLNAAEEAAQNNPQLYSANIKALKDVMPEPLKAGDIDAKIGAAWIDPKYYEQFMYETFKTPNYCQRNGTFRLYDKIELSYSETTNAYNISHKSNDKSVFATKTFGMDIRGAGAYDIFENLLNFRDTKIYKTVEGEDGKDKRVVDPEKTKLAANKAKKIQDAFSEWIFKDPERREYLVNKYNEMYNSIKPREYDGSALTFPGMNAEISLREHQKDAIAHAIYGGNTLFDHSVGAGKTFEMIASVMERKRLGISNKALMCVPNHLTEQIGDDFQKLYPNANILVATKNDFSKDNRRALISKIATGDYDAVIIGHTQLGMIPLSKETQEKYLQEEVEQLTSAIAEMKKVDGKSFGVKEAEKRKKNLQKQLDELQTRKDDIVTFEELGVDTLVLDEAHEFKNLHTPTNMQNVSGIGSAASKKASDLYMKCQYLNEKTNNKGLIFATGTPISNSVTELFTMQRYLQSDVLKAKRISHFDQWIGMFGHKVTDYQIDPTGKKFKLKTRIAKYTNMNELMSMFKSVADIKTADMMKLDVPECETNIVNVEPTQLQQELVEELAFRADKVEGGSVDPTVDNFLKITSDGRKVGLDPRLIDPDLPDDPETKLNKCVENVFKIYEDTAPDKLTQLIFCDLGVPNGKNAAKAKAEDDEEKSVAEKESFEETGPFCIYDDIKSKLIAKGVKPDEIAFIHDAKTEDQKAKLFEKVRNGEVRVLLGSTPKMGTGTNIQTRLAALHDLDVPWRPADLEQRLGRMVRQGNMNKHVKLFRYVTKGTFDAYSYQTLENKQRYISQLYTGNSRTCEDVDQQSLSYSEIKTLCTGDERLKEVMQLDNDISNLAALKRDHTNTVYEMQDKIKSFQKDKAKMEQGIEGVKKDMEICSKLPKDKETGGIAFEIKIDGITYNDKTEAAKQLERVFKRAEGKLVHGEEVKLATMYGFDVKVKFSQAWEDFSATVSGNANYSMRFSEGSHPTNIKRLMNIFDGMEQNLQNRQDILARQTAEANEAQSIASTPFPKDAELSEKIERRDTLKAVLQAEQAAKAAEGRDKQRTFHFSVAELKRNSKKIAQSKPPDKPQHGASAIE